MCVHLCKSSAACTQMHVHTSTCAYMCPFVCTDVPTPVSPAQPYARTAHASGHSPTRSHARARVHPIVHSPKLALTPALVLKCTDSHWSIPGVPSQHLCTRTPPRAPAHPRARVRAHLRPRLLRPSTGAAQRPPSPLRCPGMGRRECGARCSL